MGDDDPFWAWRSSWGPFSGQIAHPDSPIGGSGPGQSGRSRPGFDLDHSSHMPHPNSPAGRRVDIGEIEQAAARWSFEAQLQKLVDGRHVAELARIASGVLGRDAYGVGFCYGLLAHPVDEMAGLRDLALVFLWAEVYDDFYAPIGSAVRSFSAMGPASMLVRHALNAFHGHSPFRHKTQQAREQREQIVAELKAVMNDPGAFFAELPGKMKAEYTDKWRRHEALRAQPTLNSQFQAGKLAGEVTMELLLTIAGLVAIGGAAVKLATKTPQLVKWARRVTVRAGRVGAGEGVAVVEEAASVRPAARAPKPAPKAASEPPSKPPPKPAQPPLPLDGVSAAERDLAAAPTSPNPKFAAAQVQARKKVALQFYTQHGKVSREEAFAAGRGIDLSKPVRVGPPPPLTDPQYQWRVPGRGTGQYFSDANTPPSKLGILERGNTAPDAPVYPRIQEKYQLYGDSKYMESTAGPIQDEWSILGQPPQQVEGGGIQRYIPRDASSGLKVEMTKVQP